VLSTAAAARGSTAGRARANRKSLRLTRRRPRLRLQTSDHDRDLADPPDLALSNSSKSSSYRQRWHPDGMRCESLRVAVKRPASDRTRVCPAPERQGRQWRHAPIPCSAQAFRTPGAPPQRKARVQHGLGSGPGQRPRGIQRGTTSTLRFGRRLHLFRVQVPQELPCPSAASSGCAA